MIDIACEQPVRGVVAIGAFALGCHMANGFPGRVHESGLHVTAGTGSVGQDECTASVTACAVDNRMRAVEFEAGAEVVEFCLRSSAGGRCQEDNEGQGKMKRPAIRLSCMPSTGPREPWIPLQVPSVRTRLIQFAWPHYVLVLVLALPAIHRGNRRCIIVEQLVTVRSCRTAARRERETGGGCSQFPWPASRG